jgi:hypothetical protein
VKAAVTTIAGRADRFIVFVLRKLPHVRRTQQREQGIRPWANASNYLARCSKIHENASTTATRFKEAHWMVRSHVFG